MYIRYDPVNWLTGCPSSDSNFQTALQRATEHQLLEALELMQNKVQANTKTKVLEREVAKRRKHSGGHDSFTTVALRNKGIAQVKLSYLAKPFGLEEDRPIDREAYSVLSFQLDLTGNDECGSPIAPLGVVQCAVSVDPPHQLLLHKLYVEEEYRNCGAATSIIGQLPGIVKEKMQFDLDTITLGLTPLIKDKERGIVQESDQLKLLIGSLKLHEFYHKLGFEMTDYMIMSKQVSNTKQDHAMEDIQAPEPGMGGQQLMQ